MERTRFDAELAVAEPMPGIEALRVRFGYTDYEHSEIEEGSAAATFLREGWELRAEAANEAWAIFDEGVIGLQISDTDFEAFGEEIESDEGFAFGPPSKTKSQAAFVSQHIHAGDWHYEAGGRLERQTIDAQGVDDYSGVATSLSASALWAFAPSHSIGFALQHTQRHPNATELYANGPHLATSQFEVGDEDLGMEKGYGADLSYRYRGDRWDATVSVFYTIFDNYIFAQNSGMEEDGLPLFNYTEAEATFYGAELELDYLIYRSGDLAVTAGLLADYVSAENTDDNTDLPRIPPFRLGGTTELTYGNWNAGLLLRHSFDQNNTAPEETETDSYTELELELGYVFELNNRANLTLFLRGNNLLDEEIRHHTSAIKDVAPLPGRNVTLGARLAF
jgi:iron complex outermembrane receptor protein